MKEFLADVKSEFLAAKWYEKIWMIWLVISYIVAIGLMIYFILFEPSIPIQLIFFILWTVIAVGVGVMVGVYMD